jgi:hypothetical protein
LGGRRVNGGGRDFSQQRGCVDHAELVGAGVGDEELGAVWRPRERPRVRGAGVDFVEEDGAGDAQRGHVDEREGGAVHPAALDLGRGQLEAREVMRDGGGASVGRDGDAEEEAAAVGQAEGGDHGAGRGIDHADDGGDVFEIGCGCGQVVGDEEPASVRGEGRRDGLADDRDAREHLAARGAEDGDFVVEAVANKERAAVGAENGRHGGVAGGPASGDLTAAGIDDAHDALRSRARDGEAMSVGRKRESGGRCRQGDAAADFAVGGQLQHAVIGGGGDVERAAVRRGDERGRGEWALDFTAREHPHQSHQQQGAQQVGKGGAATRDHGRKGGRNDFGSLAD